MLTALTNGTIYTGEEVVEGKTLLLDDNKIAGITDNSSVPDGYSQINCEGKYIAPGFLDLQIYGAGGYLFSQSLSHEALEAMAEAILQSGTTGFFVTLATNSLEVFRKAIEIVKDFSHPAFMGIHFEGPYLNPVKRGAHPIEYIKKADFKEVEALLKEGEGLIKMMTVAPELTDPAIIQLLLDNGVTVSAGHSNATFSEANEAFSLGINTATHLFNAMSALHHREPGLPGALFESKTVSASIVADGIHVAFPVLSIAKKLMKERLFLITDAVAETKEGVYIHVEEQDRFTLPDGTLSGSKLTLLKAVENCVKQAEISLDEALRMASTYPARIIRSDDRGLIKEGYKADIVVFGDDFQLSSVFIDGKRT